MLPQTQPLKTEDTYSPQLWRPEVRHQGVSWAALPLKAPGKNLALPLPAFGGSSVLGLWQLHFNLGLCAYMAFFSVSATFPLLPVVMTVIEFRDPPG